MKNNPANRMMSYLGWSVLIVIPDLQIQISCLLRGNYFQSLFNWIYKNQCMNDHNGAIDAH